MALPGHFKLFCPGGAIGKESAYQSRRHKRCGSDPWVGQIPGSRKWQPTPVFLPGQRDLAGCSLWDCEESDIMECTHPNTHTHTHTHTPTHTHTHTHENTNFWGIVMVVYQRNLNCHLHFPLKHSSKCTYVCNITKVLKIQFKFNYLQNVKGIFTHQITKGLQPQEEIGEYFHYPCRGAFRSQKLISFQMEHLGTRARKSSNKTS